MASNRLNDIAYRRFNPLTDSWVLLASPQKNNRPGQGRIEAAHPMEKQDYDPKCYLCPGNQRATGDRNPDYTGTFLFENDYSTVQMSERDYIAEGHKNSFHSIGLTLLRAEPVIGRCYVLTYSPSHDYHMSDMTPGEVLGIVKSWTQVYTRHLSSNNPLRKSANIRGTHGEGSEDSTASTTMNLRYMQIFDNNGELVGCSNSHPHGQIWITSSMPDVPKLELSQMSKYRLENCGRHLLEEYVQLEMEQKERLIWQNDGFLAVCPWWAVWPFEVLLLPKRQVRALVDFNKTERLQFSEAILQVARSYDNLFETTFPYISAIHQAPLDATNDELESSYLHMHFSPPLLLPSVKKFFGGYELHGEPTREITPETAASYLRHSASQFSAKSDG